MIPDDDVPAEAPVEIDLSKVDEKELPKEQVKAKEPEPEAAVEEQPDEGVAELQRHLREAQSALDAERKRSAAEQQRRAQAEYQRAQFEQQAHASRETGAQAQYDAILNAIGAAEAEKRTARQDLKAAIESQDAEALADAQERLSTAQVNLVQLEDGKNAWEMRQEQYRQQLAAWQAQQAQQHQQAPQRQMTVAEAIDADQNFMPAEKQWLKLHPEVLTNPAKQSVARRAFDQATMEKGLQRGSREYFSFMDKAMGYAKRQPVVAAPPSRESASSGGEVISGSRVTLSPQQREAAKISGISEVEYARNLIKVRQAQKDGLIQ